MTTQASAVAQIGHPRRVHRAQHPGRHGRRGAVPRAAPGVVAVGGRSARNSRWDLVFQSRSRPAAVISCPIGFVSRHMDVLYDLDLGAGFQSHRDPSRLSREVVEMLGFVRTIEGDGEDRLANRLTPPSGILRFGASSWSVGSIWDKSGPPSFARPSGELRQASELPITSEGCPP